MLHLATTVDWRQLSVDDFLQAVNDEWKIIILEAWGPQGGERHPDSWNG